ncbi:BON domain-containing protein [Novosphingobium flavum]|uniref:BON domain-containing protein n=1 Tax=Novosphingobium flavum TaxID=1778672 RepID=A0A7X1KKL8_9SPHN|nr:BON domain-containing protein [Novosphingobium flavum]MBC2664676.1 BON domain-containing protein [Novosphingobium flavum]
MIDRSRREDEQQGQQGGWNDDPRGEGKRRGRTRQPEQREGAGADAPATGHGWSAQEGHHPAHGRDDWRAAGSQSFAADYGMRSGADYDRPMQRHAGYGLSRGDAFGSGYGPDYAHERSDHDPRHRGFLARAGDGIAAWFGHEEPPPRPEPDYRGRGPAGYTRSDERIREDVNDRLTDHPRLDARRITVTVENGEVTLDGKVSSRAAKRRAEDCIDYVSGVTHVQNNLRVEHWYDAWAAAAGMPTSTTGTSSLSLDPDD